LLAPALGPALFTRAIAIDYSALRQIVRRKFHVYAVTGKNSDTVAAQASGDMSKDDVAVVELDGEGRARENLLNAAQHFKRCFLNVLDRLGFRRAFRARSAFSIARRNVACSLSQRYPGNQLFKRKIPPTRRLALAILSTIRKIALLCGWILSQIASGRNLIYKRGELVAATARRKFESVGGREQGDAALVEVPLESRVNACYLAT
jgi:hypothetical protein